MRPKIKILIAEDEAVSALSMQRALIRAGYEVCDLASAGEEAVELEKQQKPDLIIMDVILNGSLNGIDAALKIRSRSDIPIVFMTGYEEEELIERLKSVETSTYLIKPITPRDLEEAIAQAFKIKGNSILKKAVS